ncbi:MAG: hypothetical protein WCK63_15540 [Betaproteobacteria bacterium]
MQPLIKTLKAIGIAAGVFALFIALDSIAYRYALFYWLCISVVVLPALFLLNWKFRLSAIASAVVALALAVSPVDIAFRSGKFGVQVLPTSRGFATLPGTIGYGCTVRNHPLKALVIYL